MSEQYHAEYPAPVGRGEVSGAYAPSEPPRVVDRGTRRLVVVLLVLQVLTLLALGVLIVIMLGIAAQVETAMAQLNTFGDSVSQLREWIDRLPTISAPELPSAPDLQDLKDLPGIDGLDGGSLPEVPQDLRDQVCGVLGC